MIRSPRPKAKYSIHVHIQTRMLHYRTYNLEEHIEYNCKDIHEKSKRLWIACAAEWVAKCGQVSLQFLPLVLSTILIRSNMSQNRVNDKWPSIPKLWIHWTRTSISSNVKTRDRNASLERRWQQKTSRDAAMVQLRVVTLIAAAYKRNRWR